MRYLDPSAIVKLIIREPETAELVASLRRDPVVVSSALALTEVPRAAKRAGLRGRRANQVLAGLALVPVDDGILRAAAELGSSTLRTLDAIHLATALSLQPDIDELVTYDPRVAQASMRAGLPVSAPGAVQI
jgi:predicted nucleic acid-binding protein